MNSSTSSARTSPPWRRCWSPSSSACARPTLSRPTSPSSGPFRSPMQPVRAERADLAHNIIDFARLLRVNDFLASPAEVQDALRAARVIDLGDLEEFYLALRSIFLAD